MKEVYIIPVDVNIASLTNPVTPILGLCIHSRVPVRVIEDDSICTGQIDTNATATSRQYEDKYLWISIESVHQGLPHLHLGCAVQTQVTGEYQAS